MNRSLSFTVGYILLALWALLFLRDLFLSSRQTAELSYSDFRSLVAAGSIAEVSVGERALTGSLKAKSATEAPQRFRVIRVEDPDLTRELTSHNVVFSGVLETTFWRDLLSWVVPIVVFAGLWLFIMRRLGQAQGGFMRVGQSKAKVYVEKDIKVTFADVAGVDEAKEELREVIEFLRTPEKFTRLGGKIPKGILLVGPPGTGKTLLARAVAGEAGVPFFSISGSEFVEMFVGVGAARVRDLFEQAKGRAPCIIFIDELDALGKARGMGPLAHEEREQTLNQLLVELDGFDPRVGVILMAATNRPEILDPALLRAGRFDRHVLVDRPDKRGRLDILRLHARRVPLAPDADLATIASMTPGFSGADLANVVNEAALLAVRRERDIVGLPELQEAVERVIAGLEKKNRVLNPLERERIACHETGHALVALALPGADPVQKISIIPRGIAALGYTLQLPTEDRFLMTQSELENKIAVLLGGRIAEELVFGETSTGAQSDLAKATDIARAMVRAYGMSAKLGSIALERDRRALLPGVPSTPDHGDYAEETAREIDCEVRRIIDEQNDRVRQLLRARRAALDEGSRQLLAKETLGGDELRAILDRNPAVS